MLTVYRRGRIYWVRGSVDGEPIPRRSLDTTDRQVADRRRRNLELEIESGLVRATWPELSQTFLSEIENPATGLKPSTRIKYRFVVERFGRFLEARYLQRLEGIEPSIIEEYTAARAADVHPTKGICVGPEGIKSDLRILRAVFSQAVKRHWMKANPVQSRRLNARVRDTQPFSREEVDRMLAAAKATDKRMRPDMPAILLTFLTTGFRLSDVTGFLKSDVDLIGGQIIRRTKKRDKTVALELHPELKLALMNRPMGNAAQQRSPFVFSSRQGKQLQNLDGILRALWQRAGVERGHAHRFRDTFSVRLLEQGASLYDVAQYLGITVAVCERHYAPYVRELRERGRRLVAAMPVASALPHFEKSKSTAEAQFDALSS